MEKRESNRSPKRLMVRYGNDTKSYCAFTKEISRTGLKLQANRVFKPGSQLQIEIDMDALKFVMWARVVWAKKVPQQLAHILDCGMGLLLIDPPADWIGKVESLCPSVEPER